MTREHSTVPNLAPNFGASSVMAIALSEARAAAERGEVPVGAVITDAQTGAVLARAGNRVEELADPTAHAAARGEARLTDCDLTVTLEPCAMCAQAIAFARLRRVIFAAYDPKGGGVEHGARIFAQPGCNHRPEVVGGIEETEAGALLKVFFQTRR
jgi:tRNA(adenine34) deaminase